MLTWLYMNMPVTHICMAMWLYEIWWDGNSYQFPDSLEEHYGATQQMPL